MNKIPDLLVVDNFLANPDLTRADALQMPATADLSSYKARRTKPVRPEWLKTEFERLLHASITDWDNQPFNGSFHLTDPTDQVVIHSDSQNYAGAIYLTPNAPVEAGTTFYRSKATGLRLPPADQETEKAMYENKLLDLTAWEVVDRVGNIFNRLVLWNGKLVHSGSIYFGHSPQTCRLIHIFFFNVTAKG